MDKNLYWKKLSRSIRWRIPAVDANEILSDYEEMIFRYPDKQDDVSVEKLGKPVQVAKMMSQSKTYYSWLVVFGLLILFLFAPEVVLIWDKVDRIFSPLLYLPFLFGAVISLIWFRTNRRTESGGSYDRKLLVMLLILLVVMIIAGSFLIGLFAQSWDFIPYTQYGLTAHLALCLTGAAAAILGGYGLVQARMTDYRWCTLYVCGLTMLMVCVFVSAALRSMSLC